MVIPVYPSQIETVLQPLQSRCVNKSACSLAVCVPIIFAINLAQAEPTSSVLPVVAS